MYFALRIVSEFQLTTKDGNSPFWWSALLFHVGKDTFSLVVDAVGACRHLPVALDLLLPAHVAGLTFFRSAPFGE